MSKFYSFLTFAAVAALVSPFFAGSVSIIAKSIL